MSEVPIEGYEGQLWDNGVASNMELDSARDYAMLASFTPSACAGQAPPKLIIAEDWHPSYSLNLSGSKFSKISSFPIGQEAKEARIRGYADAETQRRVGAYHAGTLARRHDSQPAPRPGGGVDPGRPRYWVATRAFDRQTL